MYENRVSVAAFCPLSLKKIVQNPILKRQVCPKFIIITIENNRSQNYGGNSTFYNVAMKGFPLTSRIFI